MLGNEGELAFYRKEDGLYVKAPKKKPCDCAYVLKTNKFIYIKSPSEIIAV